MVHEARDSASIIGMVAAGQGVAIVPASLRCIGIEGVRFLDLADAGARSALALVHVGRSLAGPAEALRTELLHQAHHA